MSAPVPEQVLRAYLKADKSPAQTLKASAAWIAAPPPVQAIGGAS